MIRRKNTRGQLMVHLEDDDSMMNSMEQTSNIFSRSCHNNKPVKGDIRTNIKLFQKKCL